MVSGLILGTLVVGTACAFPVAWLGLELNLMAFLPWALRQEAQKKSAIGYFIAQSLGSLMLLLGGMVIGYFAVGGLLVSGGLIIKMGLIPLHYWVPAVVALLPPRGLFVLLRWQKVAPLSLFWFSLVRQLPWAVVNAVGGGLLILTTASFPLLLVFRGMVQIGWLLSFQGGFAYYYLTLYFVVLLLVVAWSTYPSLRLGWALLNAGGLPPITGFVIKLKGLLRLPARLGGCLLAASGVALCSYTRFLVNGRFKRLLVTPTLVACSVLGAV